MYWSHGTSNSRGACIVVSPKANINILDHTNNSQGRVVCLDAELNEKRVTIWNIYAPNTDDQYFFFHRSLR